MHIFFLCFAKEKVHEEKYKNLHKSFYKDKDLYSVSFEERASASAVWLQWERFRLDIMETF